MPVNNKVRHIKFCRYCLEYGKIKSIFPSKMLQATEGCIFGIACFQCYSFNY